MNAFRFHRRPASTLHAAALLIALILWGGGCTTRSEQPKESLGGGATSGVSDAARCEEHLSNAMDALRPDRLEISSDIESTVNVLNDWYAACGTEFATEEWDADKKALLEKLLTPEQLQNIQSDRFTSRDAGHLRNCILSRDIADYATGLAKDDVERAVQVFDYLCRTVILTVDTQDLPLTPYEILLFGRGTAEQRVWVAIDLLRQLRIDAAILRPKGAAEKDAPSLLAVFVENDIFLFDPYTGTGVPAGDDVSELVVARPATLTQVRDNPALLESLRELGSRVPSAEQLQSLDVVIGGESTFWSDRMEALHFSLSGDQSYIVFDGLQDHRGAEGLLHRLARYGEGDWTEADILVTDFGDRQVGRYWNLEPGTGEFMTLDLRRRPFLSPLEFGIDKETNMIIADAPAKKQWKTRIAQLQGRSADAVASYGVVRLGSKTAANMIRPEDLARPEFEAIRRMHDLAAEDAHLWVAMTQVELGDQGAAVDTFNDYLSLFPEGRWRDAVRLNLGRTLAREERYDESLEQLGQISENAALAPAARLLQSRIETLAAAKPAEPTNE